MKNIVYVLVTLLMVSCSSNSSSDKYGQTVTDYLLKGKSATDFNFKIEELAEHGTIIVADSIAYFTEEYRKDNDLFVKRLELAKKMSEELLSKAKKQTDIDEYTANITQMNNRIDSLKNASPDNLNGYDKRSANEVLAVIVRCKYSVESKGRSVAETFDFYLSPDGSKCYGKTRAK
jgi:hypothetical protein